MKRSIPNTDPTAGKSTEEMLGEAVKHYLVRNDQTVTKLTDRIRRMFSLDVNPSDLQRLVDKNKIGLTPKGLFSLLVCCEAVFSLDTDEFIEKYKTRLSGIVADLHQTEMAKPLPTIVKDGAPAAKEATFIEYPKISLRPSKIDWEAIKWAIIDKVTL